MSGLTIPDLALLLIVAGGLMLDLAPRRAVRQLRRLWQVVLVVGLGLLLGDLLSIGLLAGWARHGTPVTTAPSLMALVGVALVEQADELGEHFGIGVAAKRDTLTLEARP